MSSSRIETALDSLGSELAAGQTLSILRATSEFDFAALSQLTLVLVQSFKPEFDRLAARGFQVTPDLTQKSDHILVQITRSKAETMGLVAAAMHHVKPGGLVLVDGSKTDGIESIQKRVKAHFALEDTLSKSHGKLFWLKVPASLPPIVAEWQTEAAAQDSPDGFLTAPGMFSFGKIDSGSALLAPHIATGLFGKGADLGAGWGYLSRLACAQDDVSEIHLFEADKASLSAAEQNLSSPKAHYHWADVLQMQAAPEYDFVLSNPPFHASRAADPDLGRGFIRKAAALLRPGGVFWLVANRQLPYEDELSQSFQHFEAVEETHHFKIIRATRPMTSARKAGQRGVSSARRVR